MATDDVLPIGLEGSPSTVASQAAIELDNLLLGRSSGTVAVQKLADMIQGGFKSDSGAAAVGVMSRALAAANASGTQPARVDEVVSQAGQVADTLRRIVAAPEDFRKANSSEVEKMRSFCIAYAEQAAASKRRRGAKPQHRYRR